MYQFLSFGSSAAIVSNLSMIRKRMLPEYGKWLTGLLTSKPKLKAWNEVEDTNN